MSVPSVARNRYMDMPFYPWLGYISQISAHRILCFVFVTASMAVADGIVGLILLFTVLPAMVWVPSVTLDEFEAYPRNTINSPIASFFGSLLTISVVVRLLNKIMP